METEVFTAFDHSTVPPFQAELANVSFQCKMVPEREGHTKANG